jgi:hypothetical protein
MRTGEAHPSSVEAEVKPKRRPRKKATAES